MKDKNEKYNLDKIIEENTKNIKEKSKVRYSLYDVVFPTTAGSFLIFLGTGLIYLSREYYSSITTPAEAIGAFSITLGAISLYIGIDTLKEIIKEKFRKY